MAYDASDIVVIEDDIEKIKQEHHMYIGFDRWEATKHLAKEIIQNSIDEAASEGSNCDLITLTCDEVIKSIRVDDNGRGVPLSVMEKVCTIIQSSGKFKKGDNNAYKYAAGTHGVGMTATNALSTKFIFVSKRDGIKKTLLYEFGHLVSSKEEEYTGPSGTSVTFIPNEAILKSVKFDYKDLFGLCRTMAYLSKVTIKCKAKTKNGKEEKEKYVSKNGIVDLINDLAPEHLIKPIHIKYEENNMVAEVAFTYAPESKVVKESDDNCCIVSFANFCTTTEGGTHVKGFRQGLMSAMSKYVKDNILTKRDNKLKITDDDVRNGLVAVVNIMLLDGNYSGQIKAKLQTEEALPFMKAVTIKGINKWIKKDERHAKTIGNWIKEMAKVRTKSSEERKSVLKNNTQYLNGLSKDKPKNWFCESPNKRHPVYGRELIIVEGQSAGGTAKHARDPRFQDIYYLRGVVKNGIASLSEMMKNQEFKGLVQALGTNVGKEFNADKCRYDRIIITTDADVDGNRITSGVCTIFMVHFYELVKRGLVYKIVPPLYKVEVGKKKILLQNNKEYAEFIQKQIASKVTISLKNKELSKAEVIDLLVRNKRYLDDIDALAKHLIVNPELAELVAFHSNDKDNYKALIKDVNKRFPFIKLTKDKKDKYSLEGLADMEYQLVKLNKKLKKKAERLNIHLNDIEKGNIYYKCNGEKVSLYTMMKKLKAYEPNHKQRYKGLGEMNADAVYDTILNVETRTLLQLRTDDYEKDMEVFNVLHGSKAKDRENRKALMSKFKIDLDDIDS